MPDRRLRRLQGLVNIAVPAFSHSLLHLFDALVKVRTAGLLLCPVGMLEGLFSVLHQVIGVALLPANDGYPGVLNRLGHMLACCEDQRRCQDRQSKTDHANEPTGLHRPPSLGVSGVEQVSGPRIL